MQIRSTATDLQRLCGLHIQQKLLLLVDSAIQAFDEFSGVNPESVADTEESPYRNGSSGFYLLPMAC